MNSLSFLSLLICALAASTSHGFVVVQHATCKSVTLCSVSAASACAVKPVGGRPLLPRQSIIGRSIRGPLSRTTTTSSLGLSSQEIIEAGVSFDTFAPQFLWLLIIGLPKADVTRKVMGSIAPIVGLSLVHLAIVLLAASQEGALDQVLIFQEVFDPSLSQLSGMQKLFAIQNFCAEEWPHVLIWDLFVGRAIWVDGIERGINTRLALTFCNFIGPPGLLIHVATCLLTGKGLPPMGYYRDDDNVVGRD